MKLTRSQRVPVPLTGLVLYLALIAIAAFAIAAADWADHLALVLLFGVLGGLVGALLARSLFSGVAAGLMATVFGLFLTGWRFSSLLDGALLPRERVFNLIGRFQAFLGILGRGEENQDPLVIVMVIAVLFWTMGVVGAWSLYRRGEIWIAAVPPGLALLANRFYYFGHVKMDLLLALYVLLMILFLLYHEVIDRREAWQGLRAKIAANASGHVAQTGTIVALALVLVSWAGPAFAQSGLAADAWSAVSGPWRQTRDRLGNAVAGLRSPGWFVGEFGDSLSLEEGVLPPEEPVMEVEANAQLTGTGRFYWRARTYDHYQDGRWSDRQGELIAFQPDAGELALAAGASREPIELNFRMRRPLDRYLYLPTQPLWVNRTSEVRVQRQGDQIVDVAAFLTDQPIYGGEMYRARGTIATPSADQLRAAPTEYPDWVTERYLQVPAGISDRILEQAERVTRDLDTPYEKTAGLTAWLRQNIEYQRVTEAPPRGQDPLDWFLFDYGVGFCNYYASAEVIMLRSLGIPARLATGYAAGDFDPERGVYEVNSRDYHAWPEVYFPGFGWVEFEPTVSEAPLIRETEPAAVRSQLGTESGLEEGEIGEFELLRILRARYLRQGDDTLVPDESDLPEPLEAFPYQRAALIAVAIFGLALWLWTRLDRAWQLTMAGAASWAVELLGPENAPVALQGLAEQTTPAHRAYQRWLSWWPRLGLEPAPDQTPAERARLFGQSYPSLAEEAQLLAEAYALERFARAPQERAFIARSWRRMASHLVGLWLRHLCRRLLGGLRLRPDPGGGRPSQSSTAID